MLDSSEGRSEIPVKYWYVVLQKDREDRLDQSCKKCRSVTEKSQAGKEYPTNNKNMEG